MHMIDKEEKAISTAISIIKVELREIARQQKFSHQHRIQSLSR
jgi:hypothetical protein